VGGLPLRQEKAYGDATNEPWYREPNSRLTAVGRDDVQDDHGPKREPDHATGGEQTDAETRVLRVRTGDRRSDGVKSGGPEAADHEQYEDEPEFGSGADQAQERRRHQHAHASDQSQPDVLAECTEDWLGHRRGNPKDGDHQGEGRRAGIEAHLKSRKQCTQKWGSSHR
jgi:hypothetical protein